MWLPIWLSGNTATASKVQQVTINADDYQEFNQPHTKSFSTMPRAYGNEHQQNRRGSRLRNAWFRRKTFPRKLDFRLSVFRIFRYSLSPSPRHRPAESVQDIRRYLCRHNRDLARKFLYRWWEWMTSDTICEYHWPEMPVTGSYHGLPGVWRD